MGFQLFDDKTIMVLASRTPKAWTPIISLLLREPGLSQGEIIKHIKLTTSTARDALHFLLGTTLIEREDDGRGYRFFVTENGRKAVELLQKNIRK